MVNPTRVPPGRAGRLWLRRMLGTVQRGREQLDRRLRVLLPELQWRRIEAERRQREWAATWQEAQTWLVRSELLSGREGVLRPTRGEGIEVAVRWTTAMGCTYPADIAVSSRPAPRPWPAHNSAAPTAARAFETALDAALQASAAEEAVRRIEADIALTRRRLHGLEKRWIPWLEESLARVEQSLEQTELDDATRLRRAVVPRPDPGVRGPTTRSGPQPGGQRERSGDD